MLFCLVFTVVLLMSRLSQEQVPMYQVDIQPIISQEYTKTEKCELQDTATAEQTAPVINTRPLKAGRSPGK
jgi:hypothetical protein